MSELPASAKKVQDAAHALQTKVENFLRTVAA